ncbi:mechanosensitive ion channel protein MscS [Comamonas serinivorans]|uniref:Mechanosensing system component YbdG n=1 Tax=Comamonas serinivorans TaxID=1082851 RepID=A0A1Y0EK06_9BURK|nr:mechanosensitive ion channel domain-containing protein [Comamonas serinivorans]ARU03790.1 mechanosensitive ion channel protein MscS [Comamonas serinivorans]
MDMAWFDALDPHWQTLLQLSSLVLASGALGGLLAWMARRMAALLRQRLSGWAAHLLHVDVVKRFTQALPSLLVQAGLPLFAGPTSQMNTVVRNVALALTVLHLTRGVIKLLDVYLHSTLSHAGVTGQQQRSIKSYIQLAQLLLAAIGLVVIVASLIDRSPLIVLSGMGAMSAVLMLVFKDTLLSFTAGVQITSNDLVRLGDWIEMPQAGADGAVIDIALNTIRVQNWDLTITTIPTWRFMSESFKNWRGMQEGGGRRIKRSLFIDAASVRFLDAQEITRLSQVQLISDYLGDKREAVQATNAERRARLGELAEVATNQRRLTNLGTFRAYVLAHLRANPDIHSDKTLMVRQLAMAAEGIPMEIYCFTRSVAWVEYERVQSDLFDHLIAILPEFGLRLYQSPSGVDMRQWRGLDAG